MKHLYAKVVTFAVMFTVCAAFAGATERTLSITVNPEANQLGDYEVTVTGTDPETPFVWFFETAEDFESKGGADGIVEAKIKQWQRFADMYSDGTPWTYFRDSDSAKGTETSTMYDKWGITPEEGVEYYVVAFGMDDDKNLTYPVCTGPYRPVPPKKEPAKAPCLTIELTDFTPVDCNLTITPSNGFDGTYYFYITTPDVIETRGGIETIDQTLDLEWWKYLASLYPGSDWTEFIAGDLQTGVVTGSASDLDNINFVWNTTYVVYAYGLNNNGTRTTEIYWKEFTMPDRNSSDITFDICMYDKAFDEENSTKFRKYYTMTLDIMPSNDEESFAFNFLETKYYDQSSAQDDIETWMAEKFVPDCYIFNGYSRITIPQIREGREYYAIVTGYDVAPTTTPVLFAFNTDTQTTRLETVDNDRIVILPTTGGIYVHGEYLAASVFTTDGRIVKSSRGQNLIDVASGCYIVKVVGASGEDIIKKVLVR